MAASLANTMLNMSIEINLFGKLYRLRDASVDDSTPLCRSMMIIITLTDFVFIFAFSRLLLAY